MFSVVCLCVGVVFGAVTAIAAIRLGSNGRFSSAGGRTNSAAGAGTVDSTEAARSIAEAVASAEQYNRETAEIVQKMRDIIERNRGSLGNSSSCADNEG